MNGNQFDQKNGQMLSIYMITVGIHIFGEIMTVTLIKVLELEGTAEKKLDIQIKVSIQHGMLNLILFSISMEKQN